MRNITIGDHVICVTGGWVCNVKLEQVPKINEEYTVRGFTDDGEYVGLLLTEVINTPLNGHEIGFDIRGFRRIYSIEFLEKLLEHLPTEEELEESM